MDARQETTGTAATQYTPDESQLSRASALRRFNALYLYTPLILVLLLVAAVMSFLIFTSLVRPEESARTDISATADAIMILVAIPLVIIGAVAPGLGILLLFQSRRRGIAPVRQVQTLFWRVESAYAPFRTKVQNLMPKLAHPVISAYSQIARIRTLLNRISMWS